MNDFATLLQQGNAWVFIPSAILLGVLHGLEPGHSKTMMAAFIIAIKGTVRQAVMLGLAATVSHTAIVWLIAFGGMVISNRFTAESAEPWLQLISAVIIVGTAMWMFWRTYRGESAWKQQQNGTGHTHDHGAHDHHHDHPHDHHHGHDHGILQAASVPHAVNARPASLTGFRVNVAAQEYQDAHERAHAGDIARRFATQEVTNWQILFFGLTGGLIPCPAAITVLLICIQLKALALGAALVVCFSLGLALTLVTVGVGAAVSVRQVAKRWSGFNTLARRAPYFSSVLIGVVGIYMGVHGVIGLTS
ncbi:nickel/cobalt efflux protein RcnA [Rahnella laticis]|uniref:nickel/cobalt efflux protein RcnA n=1 Tax=Rahnella laticis TaxID=2787622 RepID=UPI0018A29EDF|nr:nickel/cobalt efflux protein RcnA [Rahnella laticis]MBF7997544.1 nickel/cobalt efflux protein RcnA [Rahnella laticis]